MDAMSKRGRLSWVKTGTGQLGQRLSVWPPEAATAFMNTRLRCPEVRTGLRNQAWTGRLGCGYGDVHNHNANSGCLL
jgi:hypothetical protein